MIKVHINAPDADKPCSVTVPCEIPSDLIKRALHELLHSEGITRAELSVTILGDDQISVLHRKYLGKDEPTDVLSFALHESPTDAPIGDIYVGREQAARQAAQLGLELTEELVRLTLHGALHVLGYDHPDGKERSHSEMYRRQEEILARAGP